MTVAKLVGGAVTTSKLGNGAVTTEKIATSAVGMSQIADGSVTQAKLAPGVGGGSHPLFCFECNINTNFKGIWVGRDLSNSALRTVTFSIPTNPSYETLDLTGIIFDNSIFEIVNFSGNDPSAPAGVIIDLENSSFVSVIFTSGSIIGREFDRINFSNSDFTQSSIDEVGFTHVDAPNSNFAQADLNNGIFNFANLTNSTFTK